jgi:DNA-binding CsgD family transcriptional regulator
VCDARRLLTGAASLTASERRIAKLAANGATNAEIAQSLFLTVKTVEMHLTSAYRRLDIRSRRDLAAALTNGHVGENADPRPPRSGERRTGPT